MPTTTRYRLHSDGPALWPSHKPLTEVLELKATTPAPIWSSIYQGAPTPAGGTIFHREWWRNKNRYDSSPENLQAMLSACIGRWISWDTALKDKNDAAYTAAVVVEMTPDWQLTVREVYRERLEFPELPEVMARMTERYSWDGWLRGVLIEDKASGTSAYQTLMASATPAVARVLISFEPHGDKDTRAQQAAVWCKNDCILLPVPSETVPWLLDFEEELFAVPTTSFRDQADAFAQVVIYLENILARGWHARNGPVVA